MLAPPLPGRQGILPGPEASSGPLGLALGLPAGPAVGGIPLVPPGQALPDQLQVQGAAVFKIDPGHQAAVAVHVVDNNFDHAADELGHAGLGLLAKGLAPFRAVNAVEADLIDLAAAFDQKRIPVQDVNHQAGEGGGGQGEKREEDQDGDCK